MSDAFTPEWFDRIAPALAALPAAGDVDAVVQYVISSTPDGKVTSDDWTTATIDPDRLTRVWFLVEPFAAHEARVNSAVGGREGNRIVEQVLHDPFYPHADARHDMVFAIDIHHDPAAVVLAPCLAAGDDIMQ